MNKWTVIINPWAGSGLGKTEWPVVKNLLLQKGFDFKAAFTEHQAHAIDLVKEAVAHGCRHFIAMGGDGTLHEVINGAMIQNEVPASDITVGCIPVGSGNDWIKMYGIPTGHAGAIDVIAAGNTRLQDLAEVTCNAGKSTQTRYMMNIGGALFDADTVLEFTRLKVKNNGAKGKSAYIRGLINAFIKTKSCHVDLVADREPFYSGRILSVAFGIGQYSGGGLLQTPGALPDDGLLDMTVFRQSSKFRALLNIGKLFNGNILKFRRTLHTQLKTLTVNSSRPINLEIDGESVGTTPFSIRMVPAAIKVLVPGSSE